MKLSYKSILVALAALPAVFAVTVDEALNQFSALAERIDNARRSIDGYNGGVVLALPVANAIYSAHTTATGARQLLSQLEPLSPDDSQRALNAYNEIHPLLLNALIAGRAKAEVFRNAGVSYVAQGMISNLYNEKNRFENEIRAKVDPAYFQNDLAAEMDQAFSDTLAAF